MTDSEKTILIVEDEAPLALALSNSLEQEGYKVFCVQDGESGVRTALEQHPDMILADLKLPRMSGIEMIREIRADEWGKNARIIILTNVANPNVVEEAMRVGTFHYFVKSDSSMSDIIAVVKKQLNGASQT